MKPGQSCRPERRSTARVFLCETASPRLYKKPPTPRLQTQLSLILLYPLVSAEAATVACIVDFELGGSRGVSSMAAAPELFRDHGQHLRAWRGEAIIFVPPPSPSSPPVAGVDPAPELHGVGHGDTATASAKTPFRPV